MKFITAFITGFATCEINSDSKVVFVKFTGKNTFTDLPVTYKRAYICNQNFYFKDFINQECKLTIEHSTKLDKDICLNIEKVSK